jgi:drug/metabolite transporter (DMT)-like permease
MAIKAGLADLPPVLFAAIRYDVAGALLLVYGASTTSYWRPRTRRDWASVAVGAGLVIAAYNAFLFVGQQGVTSGVAAILIATNPILATAFGRVWLPGERPGRLDLGGLALGFVGVGLVAQPGGGTTVTAGLRSPLLVVLAAMSVALGSVLIQRLDADLPTVGTVAWSTAFGAVVLHAVSLGLPGHSIGAIDATPVAVASILYLAVFASAAGYVIYFDLLDKLGAIEINLVSYAAPVFAALSGWVVLGETFDALAVVGFAAIFGGFALLKREALRDRLEAWRRGVRV